MNDAGYVPLDAIAPDLGPEPPAWEPGCEEPTEAPTGGPRMQTAADFLAGFVPPEYLIEGTIQRGRLYSLTGRTGHGKTAVTLTMGAAIAYSGVLGSRNVERGTVAVFCGENPDDVRARFVVTAEAFGADPMTLPILFFEGPFSLADAKDHIERQLAAVSNLALVLIDTAAAFFGGDDEVNNVQIGRFARDCRLYTTLPGRPCVIVNWHPVKNPTSKDQLLPRGGGAAIAEVDGNLTVWSDDDGETTELHWTGKLRGPGFEPVRFRLARRTSDRMRDAKGNHIPSVAAIPMSEDDAAAAEAKVRSDEDCLLDMLLHWPGLSQAQWAEKLGWMSSTAQPLKSRVSRVLDRLKRDRLADNKRGKWTLTTAGKKEAEKLL